MLVALFFLLGGNQQLEADLIIINDGMNGTVNNYSIIFSSPSHPDDLSSPQPPVGQTSGGNPAHWLELPSIYDVNRDGNGVPVGSGTVELSFGLVNEAITYNPLTSGTVLDISFSMDINFFDTGFPVQFQEYYFWVQDGNSAFLANSANSSIFPTNGNWETITLSGLTSANLVGIDFTGGEGPLKFGFGFVSSGDVTNETGFIGISMGVDNFVVTVNAVPEPSSGLLAGSLLMFAAGRRQIRRA
jgi:hypothetical protein